MIYYIVIMTPPPPQKKKRGKKSVMIQIKVPHRSGATVKMIPHKVRSNV